jgi:hypothetical protein
MKGELLTPKGVHKSSQGVKAETVPEHTKARPVRTVRQMVQAIRLSGAKQNNLFFKSKKEKFLWEQDQMQQTNTR